ncbi:S41 family peptidase [Aquimarina longa]|uniref:S41 family peptidase n=1 Tax=Aquimarina longa TaxID=1080221 RepID=UPI0007817DCA|nr:S41 family peptidase [Aquimarina longa]
MKKIVLIIFSVFLSVVNFSCSEDDNVIIEPERKSHPSSYAEIFQLFWETMDTKYNYFYEEKVRRELDWDDVYNEYLPKFKQLTTYSNENADTELALKELRLAVNYFFDIINPLIDRHLEVKIDYSVPALSKKSYSVIYATGAEDNKLYANFPYNYENDINTTKVNKWQIRRVMDLKIDKDKAGYFSMENSIIGGYLKSNPEVYYFAFDQFFLSSFNIEIRRKTDLKLKKVPASLLPKKEKYLLNTIQNIELRKLAEEHIDTYSNFWIEGLNNLILSTEYKMYTKEIDEFFETNIVDGLIEPIEPLSESIETLKKQDSLLTKGFLDKVSGFIANHPDLETKDRKRVSDIFVHTSRNIKFIKNLYNLEVFQSNLADIQLAYPLYHNFYNKLTDGSIKKLIIDLRNNPGGNLFDQKSFTERLITQEKVFLYQRTKEGNGRFNYTPWIENMVKPHRFGISQNIPIAILTNSESISMAEITTIALKSQGDHVISIGDYTKGGTAALSDTDEFNGGFLKSTGNITFYMPLMATRDASKNVIEGIGVKPDIKISPSLKEINGLGTSPSIHDSVFERAVLEISKK